MATITPEAPQKKESKYDSEYENEFKRHSLSETERKALLSVRTRNKEDVDLALGKDRAQPKDTQEQEESATISGTWADKVTSQGTTQKKKTILNRAKGVILDKKKGPSIAIIGIVLGFLGISGFSSLLFLGPIAIIQNTTLDLDDTRAAVEETTDDFIGKKLLKSPLSGGNEPLSLGCKGITGKLPIKCRYALTSPMLEGKLKAQGITIEGEKFGPFKRPDHFILNADGPSPTRYTAEQFRTAVRTDLDLNRRITAAYNASWFSRMGPAFVKGALAKFDVTQRVATLEGTVEERAEQLKNGKAKTESDTVPKFREVINEQTQEIEYIIEGGDPNKTYSASEKARIEAFGGDVNTSATTKKLLSRVSPSVASKLTSSLNFFGGVDQACSLINLAGTASVASKVSNAKQLAQYAMKVAPLVGALHAAYYSEITPEDAEAVLKFFYDTDNREMITGFIEQADGDFIPGEIKNPDFGKNAMDSDLFHMSAGTGVAQHSLANTSYSLGFGARSLLSGISKATGIASSIINLGTDEKTCETATDWKVRTAGLIATIGFTAITAIPTGGGSVVATLAKGAGQFIAFTAATMWVSDRIEAALSFNLIDDEMESVPLERGAAVWTGLAAIHSEHALQRGMMPGNAEQIVAYQQKQNVSKQEYIARERQNSNPLDVRNPYSFIGSIALSIQNHLPNKLSLSSVTSLPANISSFVFDGFASLVNPYSVYAANLDTERYKQCDDMGYKDIKIDADVQCNVRFVMPEESMQYDPLETAEWMEGNSPDNSVEYVEKFTDTGFPKGYVPPSPNETQNIAMDFIEGAVNDFYRSRNYGDTEAGREYGKFLDFCVYRSLPFGETYEDGGAYGDVGNEWTSGKNCLKTDDEKINRFRAYTFHKSVNDDLDESPIISEVNCGPSGSSSGGSVGSKMSEAELKQQIAGYGLPAPEAEGPNGYTALIDKLKSNPDAGWAAQQMLNGEKNFKSKGGDIKEYMTTAWLWFENGSASWPDPYEVNCMSNTQHPTSETCGINSGPDKVQVAGYQAWDVRHHFQEVYKMFYTEDQLESVMQAVIDNSSKASIDPWKYSSSDSARIKGVTLSDIYAESGVSQDAFNNSETQFLSFMLGKDPNMAAGLNSYAVSDDDVVKAFRDCRSLWWAAYLCELQPLMSNMMYALWSFDGLGPAAGGANCSGSPRFGGGAGIEAVWGGEGEKDLSYGFDYGPAAGDWYSYATAYGMSGVTHTGTDIPMDPYAPVYSPVEGVVVCERNGVGDGIPGAGCAGAGDFSGTDSEWEVCREPNYDSSKPNGAGTVMIQIIKNGTVTDDAIRLGHLASSLVKVGDTVKVNQQIGTAGCMNGWHTHVEYFIKDAGTPSGVRLVDPVIYLGGGVRA